MNKLFNLKDRKYGMVSLGEIMLRLSPPSNEVMIQGNSFEKNIGGSELNVSAGVEALGVRGGVISKLPDNELGRYVKKQIRAHGVTDDFLVYDSSEDKRLGIYYYEYGAYPRKPRVIYDRNHSSFTSLNIEELPENLFKETEIFHLSGITLGLNKDINSLSNELIKKFKESDTLISFDVNFRASLWSEEEARRCIEEILPYIDILYISEESLRKMFQETASLEEIHRKFAEKYNISVIATTKREVISPKKHNFSSLVYCNQTKQHYMEEPYYNIDVIDRIGSGDAYLSGSLFGILKYNNLQKALEFGNAMSVLKNTTQGDMSHVDLSIVKTTIHEHKNKGAFSELSR